MLCKCTVCDESPSYGMSKLIPWLAGDLTQAQFEEAKAAEEEEFEKAGVLSQKIVNLKARQLQLQANAQQIEAEISFLVSLSWCFCLLSPPSSFRVNMSGCNRHENMWISERDFLPPRFLLFTKRDIVFHAVVESWYYMISSTALIG